MKVLVWGLGYVGTVSAACLAQRGHDVIGIETSEAKVRAVNEGRVLIKEPGLGPLVKEMVAAGRLRAVSAGSSLVPLADLSLICVGTPSSPNGGLLLDYVQRVAADIGEGLREATNYHVVILRSTVPLGTTRGLLCSLLAQHAGKEMGRDFGVVVNPEFLREASAIADFFDPPYVVFGETEPASGRRAAALYEGIEAPVFHLTLEEAEFLKVISNAFHALKIGFANEIGRFCNQAGLNGPRLMKVFAVDTKLNISPAYLRPGFAFGGSCLPKDLRALVGKAHQLGIELPILEAVLPSNNLHIQFARMQVHDLGVQRVGVLGLSFKPGTDDLRESPVIDSIQDLWRDGLDVTVYDPDVVPEEMLGSNLEYLQRQLPQIHQILRPTLEGVLDESQAILVSQQRPEFKEVLASYYRHLPVLDLANLTATPSSARAPVGQEPGWPSAPKDDHSFLFG